MSNLSVSGTIKQISDDVALYGNIVKWDNAVKIFDSTSVSSTGVKNLDYKPDSSTTRYSFLGFNAFLFCCYNSSAGWKTVLLPSGAFVYNTTDYVIICQNISDTNRRIHIRYESSTSFNIGYTQNCGRFVIYGFEQR